MVTWLHSPVCRQILPGSQCTVVSKCLDRRKACRNRCVLIAHPCPYYDHIQCTWDRFVWISTDDAFGLGAVDMQITDAWARGVPVASFEWQPSNGSLLQMLPCGMALRAICRSRNQGSIWLCGTFRCRGENCRLEAKNAVIAHKELKDILALKQTSKHKTDVKIRVCWCNWKYWQFRSLQCKQFVTKTSNRARIHVFLCTEVGA